MLLSSFLFLTLSFLFFVNFGFFFLSEEVLVFSSSLFFVFLVFLSLRTSARRYFFLRAYHVYVCFLYGLLAYTKSLGSFHVLLESLMAKALLLVERNRLGRFLVALRGWLSLEIAASFLQRRPHGVALELPQTQSPPFGLIRLSLKGQVTSCVTPCASFCHS
jgi:hypothetical protein